MFAQLMVWIDRMVDDAGFNRFDAVLFHVGASGGRDILGAIGGSMLAVAATAFSITIAVLATASATYGPRLVRNFMTDRGNQLVLGTFGATFLYALMVLRTITSADAPGGGFVPDFSVNLAVFFAVIDVAVLVYFIHHIADSIQVATLSERVRKELLEGVDRIRPQEDPPRTVHHPAIPQNPAGTVKSNSTGFVQLLRTQRLVAAAEEQNATIQLLVRPGDHRIPGEPLALVWPAEAAGEMTSKVRAGVVLGNDRIPQEDVAFSVQQLTEMAVRALSPSTNDPFTAQNALQELAVGLVPFCERPSPAAGHTDAQHKVRLVVPQLSSEELMRYIFDALRSYALEHPSVLLASLELAERIGCRCADAGTRDALREEIELLTAAYTATGPPPYDLHRVLARAAEVTGLLESAMPLGAEQLDGQAQRPTTS